MNSYLYITRSSYFIHINYDAIIFIFFFLVMEINQGRLVTMMDYTKIIYILALFIIAFKLLMI